MIPSTEYNQYQPDRGEKLKIAALLCVILSVAGVLFYKSLIPAAAVVFLYKPALAYYGRMMSARRRERLRTQFRDFLSVIAAFFATGRHMEESLICAEKELSAVYGPDEPMMREIRHMIYRITEARGNDIAVLRDFEKRSRLEEVSDFVQVYAACRDTGGDMINALNKSARMIGEKIAIKKEIAVMVSQKKFEGRIITCMPFVIIVFLRFISPEYLESLYSTWLGRLLMTVSLAAAAAAYYLIERITDIEV